MPTGPATVADTARARPRPSAVSTAPAGRRIVTAAGESGSTVIVHPSLLPCCRRWAFRTAPPVTVNAASRNVV